MNISSRRSRDLQELTTPYAIRPQTLFAGNGLVFSLCATALLALAPQAASAQGRLDAQYEATLAGIPVGKGAWTIEIGDDAFAAMRDGARIVNAAVALGVSSAEIGRRADAVTLCLSKGLGCPLGALVAGSAELMVAARRGKHLFGGAMRQAGIVAAAGVYALDHHVDRIAEDHARARRLAEGWAAAGLAVDPGQTETNFVHVDLGPLGLTARQAIDRAAAAGVGISDTVDPVILRAVVHLDISDDDIERAVEAVPLALGTGERVNA